MAIGIIDNPPIPGSSIEVPEDEQDYNDDTVQ